MQSAKDHLRETERLELLHSYSILDSLPEKEYDNLTKLAAEICNTPVSLITLLDNKRQWFKSHHGLDMEETPKEQAFCAHAINEEDNIFMIEDARLDHRFSDNPLVTGNPNVIFYAGIPLKNKSGLPLGTLCVIDNKPHKLTQNQIEALNILSEQVMNLMELRKSKLDLEIANVQLTKFSQELENKVVLRTKELELKNRELEAMNTELRLFTFISSHDLQEPLRKIQMFISQIFQSEAGKLSAKGLYKFERIQSAANRMQTLIQDLLTYSTAENIGKKTVKVNLSELVEETMDSLEDELLGRSPSVEIEEDCHLEVFPSQVVQLLYNLISNAIKFAKDEGPSIIRISGQKVESSQFPDYPLSEFRWYNRITIADNGIGFEQQYADQVFKIFQRLHGPKEYPGTGIGLAIVKKVVRNHKGFIRVESYPEKGSKFEIFFPVKIQEEFQMVDQ